MKTIKEIIENNIEDLNGVKLKDLDYMVVDIKTIAREICEEIEKMIPPKAYDPHEKDNEFLDGLDTGINQCRQLTIRELRKFKKANGLEE